MLGGVKMPSTNLWADFLLVCGRTKNGATQFDVPDRYGSTLYNVGHTRQAGSYAPRFAGRGGACSWRSMKISPYYI